MSCLCQKTESHATYLFLHTHPVVPDDILEAWPFPRRSSRKPARLAEPSSNHGVWFPSCTGQQTTSPAEANSHHLHRPAPDDKLLTGKSSHSSGGMEGFEVSPPASGLRAALREYMGSTRPWKWSFVVYFFQCKKRDLSCTCLGLSI